MFGNRMYTVSRQHVCTLKKLCEMYRGTFCFLFSMSLTLSSKKRDFSGDGGGEVKHCFTLLFPSMQISRSEWLNLETAATLE